MLVGPPAALCCAAHSPPGISGCCDRGRAPAAVQPPFCSPQRVMAAAPQRWSRRGAGEGGDCVKTAEVVTQFTGLYDGSAGAAAVPFERALAEINGGEKKSDWQWHIWPARPKAGKSNLHCIDEDGARAFLADGYLRGCYLLMMQAVAEKLEGGVQKQRLCGGDEPKLRASCELFIEVAAGDQYQEIDAVCERVLAGLQ